MREATISVKGLHKSFREQQVLRDINLEIAAGETLALLGRNGAGKTTMIRTLLGLLKPDSGSIRVGGFDPADSAIELRSRLGYLAEDQKMYGWMTPPELFRYMKPFYPGWDDQLASKLLSGFEIPGKQRIDVLSKGQTVKLGLCLALAHRPAIAILDDPALGLDPIARKQFSRDLVDHLQGSGCTVLYSSHLLHEVEAVADQVAILDEGRIVLQLPTEELRRRVKQIELSVQDAALITCPDGLLDLQQHGDRLVMVINEAPTFIEALCSQRIDYEAVDLNLDDIFSAFVIGRPRGWPDGLSIQVGTCGEVEPSK